MIAFEVFGDSNVAKAWKAVASEDWLTGSILHQTTTLVSLRDNLKTVAQTTRHLLVAALSNPISRIKFEGVATLGATVTDCLGEICNFLIQTSNTNPELKVRGLCFIPSNYFSIFRAIIKVFRHISSRCHF
jgi:hypothetical protein